MESGRCKTTLDYIERAPKLGHPVRMLNALTSGPLKFRTFGGNSQYYGNLDHNTMETAFGGHYLLTQLAQCAINSRLLYTDNRMHTLYCDKSIYAFLDSHKIFDLGFWDEVDYKTIESNINPQNTDMRIYYSASKPDALMTEASKAKNGEPVLFIDSDLILKRRHDHILEDASGIRAAYGHLEAINTDCYPEFKELHFPEGMRLADDINTSLPAVNTCLMFFNDISLLKKWCVFFKGLFINNFIERPVDSSIISRQLLGIDQRTFPIVSERLGYWGTEEIVPFMDIIWNPPSFSFLDGRPAEWHYYTLEPVPETENRLQDITHIWISKKDIENDGLYRSYQGCLMIEIILALMPEAERALRSFDSLMPYFSLLAEYGSTDVMLAKGAVSDRLVKNNPQTGGGVRR